MKTFLLLFLIAIIFPLQAQKNIPLSIDTPPPVVTLFGKDVISTSINERDFALSPDGTKIFYTISTPKSTFQTIVYSRKAREAEWTLPEVAAFAGEYSDLEPEFSADGMTLYFSSNRPLRGKEPKDFDIWKITWQNDSWGTPENLGVIINSTADEFYPSVAKNGNLYFTAAYAGGIGKEDIYLSIIYCQWLSETNGIRYSCEFQTL